MGVYVITGGSTGIGAATRQLLTDEGHEVFNIDYKGGDFQADLSREEGVSAAIQEVFNLLPTELTDWSAMRRGPHLLCRRLFLR